MANWLVSCAIIIAGAIGINRLADRDEHNPEFFTKNGVTHPVRHGKGVHKEWGGPYEPDKAKGDRAKVESRRDEADEILDRMEKASDEYRKTIERLEAAREDPSTPKEERKRLRAEMLAANDRYYAVSGEFRPYELKTKPASLEQMKRALEISRKTPA